MKSFLSWTLAGGALVLKLILALYTCGSNDVRTWESDLTTLHSAGFAELYRSGVQFSSPTGALEQRQAFIHPPAVLHLLQFAGGLQNRTKLPLRFWLRAACALADAGTFALLWRMFPGRNLMWVAISPVSILISGFHGNTDPIMMFFAVATVLLANSRNPAWSGAAFAMACSIKLVPLIFAPAIFLSLATVVARIRWTAAMLTVWIALGLPFLAQEPALILRNMLGYSGASGLWGFSLLATLVGGGTKYPSIAKWIALFAASCAPLLLRRNVFTRCGLSAFIFLALSPGFGLQYLSWTIPWTARLGWRAMAAYQTVTGAFALAVYVAAAQNTALGVYADLLNPLHFPMLILTGIIGWSAIAAAGLHMAKPAAA